MLNLREAAELIQQATGRSCSWQNFQQHVKKGRITDSVIKDEAGRTRFDPEKVVQEYVSKVSSNQAGAARSMRSLEPTAYRPPSGDDLPDYNESRARAEFERANILEMDRRQREGELLLKSDVEKAWSDAISASKVKLLAIPTMVKQRIPHLDLEEVNIITDLVREALEDLSGESQE